MIEIDGSLGEGGGQILRSALSLSLATGRAFRIRNVRAGREKPGLLRQHLTAVEAAVAVGGGEATGAAIGSLELTFEPGVPRAGSYAFRVGTAGSTTLVLQTVLPVLLLCDGASRVELEGGTHNPFAPPFEFLERTLLPVLGRAGGKAAARLERPGFYPAGGGRIVVDVEPSRPFVKLDLLERGEIHGREALARVANLSPGIAAREIAVVRKGLSWPQEWTRAEEVRGASGPGNVLTLAIESDALTEVFTGFGRRDASAERVAGEVVDEVRAYLASGAPVGRYLADQLLVPLALAAGGRFRTVPPTRHTRTNAEIVRAFLDASVAIVKEGDASFVIDVEGAKS